MRLWIKAALMCVLVVAAAVTAGWALRSIKASAEDSPPVSYEWSCSEADAEFVLREYLGYVGVFNAGSGKTPITVTDIETGSLRDADRNMLNAGIAVADRDELLTLLEDLGS
ncbi:MAG TPA: hypothetical protein DC001_00125 [Clostridiales bacterium]|jgi:beta-lactam-binding protein with PASTA domain|nr:hypothetical protein [Clostridiales bacterium]